MQPVNSDDSSEPDRDARTDGGAVAESLDDVEPMPSPASPGQTAEEQSSSPDYEQRLEEFISAHPAQDKLHADQQEFLQRWEREGYEDRRAVLKDLLELSWLSIGRANPDWLAEAGRDNVLLSCLITSSNRDRYRPDPVGLDDAQQHRRRIAKKHLRPACRAGYREMRADAAEYVQEDNRVQLEDVSMFGMRPAVSWLKDKQELALEQFLDGFESETQLDRWLHRFDEVALGQAHKIESDIDWRIEMEPTAKRVLLSPGGPREVERTRENIAARYVVPALALAPDIAMQHAQELREESDENNLQRFDMT